MIARDPHCQDENKRVEQHENLFVKWTLDTIFGETMHSCSENEKNQL